MIMYLIFLKYKVKYFQIKPSITSCALFFNTSKAVYII